MENKEEIKIFKVIKTPDEKFMIVTGGLPVSHRKFESEKEALEYIEKKPWELIFGLVLIIMFNEKAGKIDLGTTKIKNNYGNS